MCGREMLSLSLPPSLSSPVSGGVCKWVVRSGRGRTEGILRGSGKGLKVRVRPAGEMFDVSALLGWAAEEMFELEELSSDVDGVWGSPDPPSGQKPPRRPRPRPLPLAFPLPLPEELDRELRELVLPGAEYERWFFLPEFQ